MAGLRTSTLALGILATIVIADAAHARKNPCRRHFPLSEMIFTDLEAFNAAAGRPPVVIDFDGLDSGADISGMTMCGVRFEADNAPLIVAQADLTFTLAERFRDAPNAGSLRLRASSGANLLSPGGFVLAPGSLPAVEDDDITMHFDPPVACVGFDVCPQLCDGMSMTRIEVWGPQKELLYVGDLPISGDDCELRHFRSGEPDQTAHADGGRGWSFWGVVSDQCNIALVYIDEYDDNDTPADSNLGIDTLRFAPSPTTPGCGRGSDPTRDGHADSADLLVVMTMMGACNPGSVPNVHWCEADLDRNGVIDTADLVALLSNI